MRPQRSMGLGNGQRTQGAEGYWRRCDGWMGGAGTGVEWWQGHRINQALGASPWRLLTGAFLPRLERVLYYVSSSSKNY
jgi:hypothetical protein